MFNIPSELTISFYKQNTTILNGCKYVYIINLYIINLSKSDILIGQ